MLLVLVVVVVVVVVVKEYYSSRIFSSSSNVVPILPPLSKKKKECTKGFRVSDFGFKKKKEDIFSASKNNIIERNIALLLFQRRPRV